MTPVFTVRRRAEEFASLIEDASTSGRHDARYADFLDIVAVLREAPAPQARPEFVSTLRELLMSAADTLLVPVDDERLALPARKPSRDRRIAAAIGGFAIVGATTSMAMAAQSALPGDVLYPLKRAIENAEAGISVSQGARAETLLASASGRLDEVAALSREGRLDDGPAIAATLNTFTEQATEASDLLLDDYASTGQESSIVELRDFTAISMQTLADLEELVPIEARDELLHAARVLSQIDAEAQQACPTCGGDGITEIPAILTSAGLAGFAGFSATTRTGQVDQSSGNGDGDGEPNLGPKLPQANEGSLPPGSVLNPPAESETSAPPAQAGSEPPSGPIDPPIDDPIGGLTQSLSGGPQPTSSPTGLPRAPELDDDVVDPLTNP